MTKYLLWDFLCYWLSRPVVMAGMVALIVALVLWAVTAQAQQGDCVRTYREPGCVGGAECVRQEMVPCDTPEPSLMDHLQEGMEGIFDGEDDEDQTPRETINPGGVRG